MIYTSIGKWVKLKDVTNDGPSNRTEMPVMDRRGVTRAERSERYRQVSEGPFDRTGGKGGRWVSSWRPG